MAPELDDVPLGRLRARLTTSRMIGQPDTDLLSVQQLLRETGEDWDRRAHRLSVLSGPAFSVARHWHDRRPRDPDALVLRAWSQWTWLRRAAADPSWSAGASLIDVRGTLDLCTLAAGLRPYDPMPWVIRLGLLRLDGQPRSALLPTWSEVRSRDPWNRAACLEALGYLSPAEQGSLTDLLAFVDSMRAEMPSDAPAISLPLTAGVLLYHRRLGQVGLVSQLEASRYWSQPDAVRTLDRSLEELLSPGFLGTAAALADLNLLAYALAKADRLQDAGRVFVKLDGIVTSWPWGRDGDPVEAFTQWQRRVFR